MPRCPNGTRRNSKTKICEKKIDKNTSIKYRKKEKMETTINVSFIIDVQLFNSTYGKIIKKITKKHIQDIKNNIIKNAHLNSNDNIVSKTHGIIELIDLDILVDDEYVGIESLQINKLKIIFNAKCKKDFNGTIKSAEDIIEAIMPASYSDPDYPFVYLAQGPKKNSINILKILKSPQNIIVN